MHLFTSVALLASTLVWRPWAVSSTHVSSEAHFAVRDTINRYPLAIDLKNFAALSNIFTRDVVADYAPPLGILVGLPSIQSTLKNALVPVTTQHGLTTQVLTFQTNSIANTTTYYTAQHFGRGIWEGQRYTAYGRYEDHLILTSSGWRINKRQLIYMGPGHGNPLIFGNGTS